MNTKNKTPAPSPHIYSKKRVFWNKYEGKGLEDKKAFIKTHPLPRVILPKNRKLILGKYTLGYLNHCPDGAR